MWWRTSLRIKCNWGEGLLMCNYRGQWDFGQELILIIWRNHKRRKGSKRKKRWGYGDEGRERRKDRLALHNSLWHVASVWEDWWLKAGPLRAKRLPEVDIMTELFLLCSPAQTSRDWFAAASHDFNCRVSETPDQRILVFFFKQFYVSPNHVFFKIPMTELLKVKL